MSEVPTGRICLELDRRRRADGRHARLVRRDLGIDGDATPAAHHARLVGALRQAGALAGAGRPGVLALTANTLQAPRGRLLCALVTRQGEDPQAVGRALDACLASAGLHRAPRPTARVA